MAFSPRFKFLSAVKLRKQGYICWMPQPTASRVSKECPVASIPVNVVVCVKISVSVIKLCTFESADTWGIRVKATSTCERVPM